MPKISVIIPVYNAGKYITKTLDSVINQTLKDFEIICINDKSTDNSLEILEEFSKKNSRIKVINNPQNLGAALTRNTGIDLAQGEYIYFLDSDDYIEEKYLECMVNKIEKENCDIVLNLSIINEANGISTEYKHPSMPEINKEGEYIDKITTIHDAPCFTWARLYRKSFLNQNQLRFLDAYADDVVFNTISSLYAEKTFVFFGEKYHYIINSTGLTGIIEKSGKKDYQHINAYSLIYDYLKEHDMLDDRLKLFRVYPFMKVDTAEKYDCYKNFFEKIENDFHKNEGIYNDMEKFFAYSILNTSAYDEYLKNYNKVVTIGFLRKGKTSPLSIMGNG